MKKFVIAAAFAATVMSTGAQAESFADACGHIDNPTRFNPVELSEFQECWIDFHKADESAGMIGSIFWARAGDGFVSMPVKELREAGSKDAAKAVVVEAIVGGIAEDVHNRVIAQRDALQADINTALADRDFETAAELAEEVDRLQGIVDTFDPVAIGNNRVRLAKMTARFGLNLPEGTAGYDVDRATRSIDNNNGTSLSDSEAYRLGSGFGGWAVRFTNSDGSQSLAAHSSLTEMDVNLFADELNQAIDEAYDSGYDNGYSEGFTDGYRVGFADGVASVR